MKGKTMSLWKWLFGEVFYKQLSETQMAKRSIDDLNEHAAQAFNRYRNKDGSGKNRDDVQYAIRVLLHIDGRLAHAERLEESELRQVAGGQRGNFKQQKSQGGIPK